MSSPHPSSFSGLHRTHLSRCCKSRNLCHIHYLKSWDYMQKVTEFFTAGFSQSRDSKTLFKRSNVYFEVCSRHPEASPIFPCTNCTATIHPGPQLHLNTRQKQEVGAVGRISKYKELPPQQLQHDACSNLQPAWPGAHHTTTLHHPGLWAGSLLHSDLIACKHYCCCIM